MSYIHFTKLRRLKPGAGYLRHSDYSVGAISELCGYTQSSFTKAFREFFNEAPISFRNRLYLINEKEYTNAAPYCSRRMMIRSMLFSPDRTEDINCRITNYIIISSHGTGDPVKTMVDYLGNYQKQLYAIKTSLELPGAMIITGTLTLYRYRLFSDVDVCRYYTCCKMNTIKRITR